MDLIKIAKDTERVKSILNVVELIEKRIEKEDKSLFFPLILFDYYEIIKELITAILLCDGLKTLSHKDLIEYIEQNHKEFDKEETISIDKLRILRNRIVYEGFQISKNYLINYEPLFKRIIKKLKVLINNKLK